MDRIRIILSHLNMNNFRLYWNKTKEHVIQEKRAFIYSGTFISIFLINDQFGYNLTKCVGPSMEPTIATSGETVIVDRFSRKFLNKPLQKGDIVIARSPKEDGKLICKRIQGVPGDRIHYTTYFGGSGTFKLGEGEIWLLGDNPANSFDSRHYGPVPIESIQGKVIYNVTRWKFYE